LNYILEINAFERRMKRQPLPTTAQLLWYKLMAFANRQHWPEWFSVDNDRLTTILGAGSDQTVRKARQQLIDAGLLIYEKGVKKKPGRYKLVSIAFQEYPDAAGSSDVYPANDRPGIEGYLEDDYTRYFGYTEAIGSEIKSVTQELLDTFRPGERATQRDELEVFHKIIDREGTGPESTVLTVSEEKKALLVYAFEQASLAGVVNWRYINGIYRNMRMRDIKNVDQACDYDFDRDYRMGR
jgi:hypothetical protein